MTAIQHISWDEIESSRATLRDALYEIGLHDPDGKESRPTEADYVRFRTWVIDEFGIQVWRVYRTAEF